MLALILIQERYKWRRFDDETEELTDAKGREVLDRIANRGYMAGLRNARKNCIKDFGHDTEKWKKMVPLWCRNSNN
jgi:hypothetical protein